MTKVWVMDWNNYARSLYLVVAGILTPSGWDWMYVQVRSYKIFSLYEPWRHNFKVLVEKKENSEWGVQIPWRDSGGLFSFYLLPGRNFHSIIHFVADCGSGFRIIIYLALCTTFGWVDGMCYVGIKVPYLYSSKKQKGLLVHQWDLAEIILNRRR